MCNLIRQKVCSSIKKHEVEYKKLELTIIVTYSHFWKAVDDLFSNFFSCSPTEPEIWTQ